MSKKFSPVGVGVQLNYRFDGGAASYIGIGIPSFALRTHHHQRREYGSPGQEGGASGSVLRCLITLGVYGPRAAPRLQRWIVEHQQVTAPLPAAHEGIGA